MDLELVSRELGITVATLSGWRADFQAGGQAALKSRSTDDPGPMHEAEALMEPEATTTR
jgi:transposase-like protein